MYILLVPLSTPPLSSFLAKIRRMSVTLDLSAPEFDGRDWPTYCFFWFSRSSLPFNLHAYLFLSTVPTSRQWGQGGVKGEGGRGGGGGGG